MNSSGVIGASCLFVRSVVLRRRVAGVKMRDQWGDRVVDNQIRAAWLRQLQAEFEDICYQYRVNLQLPIFELSDAHNCLGSWNDRYRLLSISTYLIRTYPWATTLQVLKHEMAHQICSDLFGAPVEGHGSLFQKACSMLGLHGAFCRAESDCAEVLDTQETSVSPQTENGRRILSKVEKLLALAGSDNEHEAALAMQRAGELLSRHNLAMPAAVNNDYLHVSLNTGKQRMPGHLRSVGSLLQDYFFVQIVFATIYDPEKDVTLRTIELFGRPENVAVAEHCYYFLTTKLVSLWQENKHRFKGSRQRARNSYFHGVIAGFREKLSFGEQNRYPEKQNHPGPSVSALVVLEDAGLQHFTARHYPRLVKGTRSTIRLHADAYHEAVATGKTLVLHRAMEESGTTAGRLLE